MVVVGSSRDRNSRGSLGPAAAAAAGGGGVGWCVQPDRHSGREKALGESTESGTAVDGWRSGRGASDQNSCRR